MKITFLFFVCLNLAMGQKASDWQTIFNGKNLDGWDIKISGHNVNDNYKNTFKVQNGMLQVSYQQYETFDNKYGHLYYKTPFSHYILNYEYRFTGNQTPGGASWNVRNSGVMFHSQSAESFSHGDDAGSR